MTASDEVVIPLLIKQISVKINRKREKYLLDKIRILQLGTENWKKQ